MRARAAAVGLVAVAWTSVSAAASPNEPSEAAVGTAEPANELDWYDSYGHVVRLDLSLGRSLGEDLGAGGFGLWWEWWPTGSLSFAARTWIQAIRVPSTADRPSSDREAAGAALVLQVATPGPLKAMVGVGAGFAAVNGHLPPSDRWRRRPPGPSGVVEAHGGLVLMARPITLHALGSVHLYTQGPPVLALGVGGGAFVQPGPPVE